MSNQKYGKRRFGKGYYIALILCATAIGISGYVYHRNTNQTPSSLETPDATVGAASNDEDLPVAATLPASTGATEDTRPDSTLPTQRKDIRTVSPVQGQTVAAYAMECLGYNPTTRDWRVHNGVDIAAEEGTPVCAAADGTVYSVYTHETLGVTVVISHAEGYTTQYSSLSEDVAVKPGDEVKLGQAIGTVGQTALLESAIGDHVHFSVSCNGEAMDPAQFLAME